MLRKIHCSVDNSLECMNVCSKCHGNESNVITSNGLNDSNPRMNRSTKAATRIAKNVHFISI